MADDRQPPEDQGQDLELAPITPEQEREHARHAALGENHWFSCPLCDDEDPDA